MPGLFATPHPPDDATIDVTATEVVVDLFEKPHLLTRVSISGAHFPERALEPYVTVGSLRSKYVRIAPDGLRVDAYFDRALPKRGEIIFGYGDSVELVVPQPFRENMVGRLDRGRLSRSLPDLVDRDE